MKRYLTAALFAVITLSGCEDNKNSTTIYGNPNANPPSIGDNQEPAADLAGVTNLSSGYVSVPSSSGNGFYTLLYYTPETAADGITRRVSYNISASGPLGGWGIMTQNGMKSLAGTGENELSAAHGALRETENLLLESGEAQASPYLRKGPSEVSVGDKWDNVYISRDASKNTTLINTACVAISNYAYFFLEDGLAAPGASAIKAYTEGFDAIYPVMHEKFGKENDVDGNGKIIILFFSASNNNLYGYFSSADKYPASTNKTSNQADMLYVNYNAVASNMNDVMATLAHEFQHMILFDNRYNEGLFNLDVWINEGLSMQAEYYTGYWDKQAVDYVSAFFEYYPSLNLTSWDYTYALSYGYSMMYIRYLAERFGDGIVGRLYKTPYTGVYAVEDAAQTGFNDIFKDFVLALFISGRGISDDPKYNFKTVDIPSYGGLRVYGRGRPGSSASNYIYPYSMHLLYWAGSVNGVTLNGGIKGYGAYIE